MNKTEQVLRRYTAADNHVQDRIRSELTPEHRSVHKHSLTGTNAKKKLTDVFKQGRYSVNPPCTVLRSSHLPDPSEVRSLRTAIHPRTLPYPFLALHVLTPEIPQRPTDLTMGRSVPFS